MPTVLVEDPMSTDVVTVERGATRTDAGERLLVNDVCSAIAVDGDGAPNGVSFEDIVDHRSVVRREAGELESAGDRWESSEF